MPKEHCHWVLAEKIRKNLTSPFLQKIIQENINLYYFGAVVLDSPFYRFWGKKNEKFQTLGQKLHGYGKNNTLSFLSPIAGHYGNYTEAPLWSCLLGMVTHVVVDSQFHPLIYYFCGSRFSDNPQTSNKAVYRHRLLETYLDFLYKQNFRLPREITVDSLYFNLEMENHEFITLVNQLYFPHNHVPLKEISKTINVHRIIQKSFYNKNIYNLVKTLNFFPFFKLDNFLVLFYFPEKKIPLHFQRKLLNYLHPVSGVKYEESILDIEKRILQKTHDFFSLIDQSIRSDHPEKVLGTLKGPSLFTGLSDSSPRDMNYFYIQEPEWLFS